MIDVTRKSDLTGKMNTMRLNVTLQQLDMYANGHGLLQEIFPHLSREEREFIKTGITPEEWNNIFGSPE